MIQEAVSYLKHHKRVVFLTSFGISVAIACMLSVRFLSDGVKSSLNSEMEKMGSSVSVLQVKRPDGIPADFADILLNSGAVSFVSPRTVEFLESGDETYTVYGVNSSFFEMCGLKLSSGSFFSDRADDHELCVIGSKVKTSRNIILIGKTYYRVSGVLEEGSYDLNGSYDNAVLIPNRYLHPSEFLFTCAYSEDDERIRDILHEYLTDSEYEIRKNAEFSESVNTVTRLMTKVLSFISGISLFVSLSGLVSVTYITGINRKREWGIRKSCGAGRKEIICQLLIESGMISIIGFLFGAANSLLITAVFSYLLEMEFVFQAGVLLKTGLLSAIMGMTAGIVPAWNASGKSIADCIDT